MLKKQRFSASPSTAGSKCPVFTQCRSFSSVSSPRQSTRSGYPEKPTLTSGVIENEAVKPPEVNTRKRFTGLCWHPTGATHIRVKCSIGSSSAPTATRIRPQVGTLTRQTSRSYRQSIMFPLAIPKPVSRSVAGAPMTRRMTFHMPTSSKYARPFLPTRDMRSRLNSDAWTHTSLSHTSRSRSGTRSSPHPHSSDSIELPSTRRAPTSTLPNSLPPERKQTPPSGGVFV